MSDRTWVKHPALGVVKEVAASAVRVLVRGGWQQLTDDEVTAHEADLRADREARVAALTPPSPERPAPEPDKTAPKNAVTPEKAATPEKATAPAATPEKQES